MVGGNKCNMCTSIVILLQHFLLLETSTGDSLSCAMCIFFPFPDLLRGSTTMARGCDMLPSNRVFLVWEALSSLATLIVFL